MNLFQVIALSFLAALLVIELVYVLAGGVHRRLWTLRVMTWIATAVAIARPDHLTKLARTLGITTGANLVSYLMVLLFLCTSLYFYARYLRLQQQITEIVRHLAIRDVQRPDDDAQADVP